LSIILTVRDGHPPFFHLVLLALRPLLGEHAGRWLAAAAGIATIPLVAVLGQRMFDRRTGVWAAFLLAISPLHVWYSREGRMYALYVLLAVLSTLAVERVVRRGGLRAYTDWAVVACLGVLTHYGFVVLLAIQVGFVAVVIARAGGRPRDLAPLIAVTIGGMCAIVPWVSEFATGPLGSHRGFTPYGLPYTAFSFLVGFGIGPTLTDLHWLPALTVLRPHALEIAATLGTLAFLGVLVLRNLGSPRIWNVYVMLWLVLPPLLLVTQSGISGTPQNVRYVLASLPAFVLLIADVLRRSERVIAAGVLVVVVLLSSVSLYRQYADTRYHREDVRSAAAFLKNAVGPYDRLVVTGADQRLPLHYYLGPARIIEKLPMLVVHDDEEAATVLALWLDRRTWVVFSREWGEDPGHALRDAILRRNPNALAARFTGVDIYRLEP
jgi:4-amino-4-deoxy-L-arabinose transferase-like glycosyltransferase